MIRWHLDEDALREAFGAPEPAPEPQPLTDDQLGQLERLVHLGYVEENPDPRDRPYEVNRAARRRSLRATRRRGR